MLIKYHCSISDDHYAVVIYTVQESELVIETLQQFVNLNIEYYVGTAWIALSSLAHYVDFKEAFLKRYNESTLRSKYESETLYS